MLFFCTYSINDSSYNDIFDTWIKTSQIAKTYFLKFLFPRLRPLCHHL